MTDPDRRQAMRTLACAALATLAWPAGAAPAHEAIPLLKILFGYPPGGVGELVTRGVGQKLVPDTAKAVIVESKPGAAGRLIMDTVKAAPADGTAVLVTPSSVVSMYPHVYGKLNYDPFRDLVPISTICEFVHGIAVGSAVPESVKTLADLLGWFKANPDKASVGNPGEGSLPHFLTLLLARASGLKLEAIAYAGGPPGVKDTIGGQVPAMIATEGQFAAYLHDGKLRLLATSGRQRSRFSPQVPTFSEQGIATIQVSEWIGMFAPARTPAPIVDRLSAAVREVLLQTDLVEKFAAYAIQPVGSSPEELGRRLKADYDFWGPTIKSTGFSPLS